MRRRSRKEKIALRRAIAMAYKVDDQIRIIRKGQAVRAHYPIPPGVAGHDPDYRSEHPVRPARGQRAARQVRLPEGRRRLPPHARRQAARDPLLVDADRARPPVRRADEALARLDRHPPRDPQGPLPRADQAREPVPADDAQRRPGSPTTPTATTSCSSSTGRTAGRATTPATARPSSTGATRRSRLLPDGPERDRLYREMTRLMETDTVWILADSRYRNVLLQPHVRGFKKHPVLHARMAVHRP